MMDTLRQRQRYEQVYCRQIFETKLMIKRKTDEQEDIVDVVTGSKGVE